MAKDEEVELHSKSTLRIGPMYAMFLLPKDGVMPPAAAAAAAAAEAGAGGASKRAKVPYGHVLEFCYNKHFAAYGAFTVHDMARLALVEFPSSGLADDVDKLRGTLQKSLNTNHAFEAVAGADVPAPARAAFEAGNAGKKVAWFTRVSPELAAQRQAEAKAAKVAAAAAAAAAGGGGGGGEDVMILG